eukprot:GHVU01222078.1.p1 GENE.GHVU01222078.1~~GHVU01222078.1.p1  ORF type:complete len:304 (+),score=60.84 GHVU01222078.1:279-1190(+)
MSEGRPRAKISLSGGSASASTLDSLEASARHPVNHDSDQTYENMKPRSCFCLPSSSSSLTMGLPCTSRYKDSLRWHEFVLPAAVNRRREARLKEAADAKARRELTRDRVAQLLRNPAALQSAGQGLPQVQMSAELWATTLLEEPTRLSAYGVSSRDVQAALVRAGLRAGVEYPSAEVTTRYEQVLRHIETALGAELEKLKEREADLQHECVQVKAAANKIVLKHGDESGAVSKSAFISLFTRERDSDALRLAVAVFDGADVDRKGFVTRDDLVRGLTTGAALYLGNRVEQFKVERQRFRYTFL